MRILICQRASGRWQCLQPLSQKPILLKGISILAEQKGHMQCSQQWVLNFFVSRQASYACQVVLKVFALVSLQSHHWRPSRVTRSIWACFACRGVTTHRGGTAQATWLEDGQTQAQLKACIEHVLRLMYEEHFELPFIATYRKEVHILMQEACMHPASVLTKQAACRCAAMSPLLLSGPDGIPCLVLHARDRRHGL